jgi:hypothetical protein
MRKGFSGGPSPCLMMISPVRADPGFLPGSRSADWRCRMCRSHNEGKVGSARHGSCATSDDSVHSDNRRCRALFHRPSLSSWPRSFQNLETATRAISLRSFWHFVKSSRLVLAWEPCVQPRGFLLWRAGNSAMMRRRSSPLIWLQRAISSKVRPHPEQRPLPGS